MVPQAFCVHFASVTVGHLHTHSPDWEQKMCQPDSCLSLPGGTLERFTIGFPKFCVCFRNIAGVSQSLVLSSETAPENLRITK